MWSTVPFRADLIDSSPPVSIASSANSCRVSVSSNVRKSRDPFAPLNCTTSSLSGPKLDLISLIFTSRGSFEFTADSPSSCASTGALDVGVGSGARGRGPTGAVGTVGS